MSSSDNRLKNFDPKTVKGFGSEWATFNQSPLLPEELQVAFDKYFSLISFEDLGESKVVLDVGCGSGRWAQLVAPKVTKLHLIDPSSLALEVAKKKMRNFSNCEFHLATTQDLPVEDGSCDLVYSLGVLHHVPDTFGAIKDCVKKLRPGAPLLLYLYYRFDNRPIWFKALWKVSNFLRIIISCLPFRIRHLISGCLAVLLYLPLSRIALLLEKANVNVSSFPLSFYRNSSLYTMRTDALDRFGTNLEHRFTKVEIREMMQGAGLERVMFRDSEPFWCAVGYKSLTV
jgi:SAM-dependent methyltransferase